MNCNVQLRDLIAFGCNAYPKGKTVAENTATLTVPEVGFWQADVCRAVFIDDDVQAM